MGIFSDIANAVSSFFGGGSSSSSSPSYSSGNTTARSGSSVNSGYTGSPSSSSSKSSGSSSSPSSSGTTARSSSAVNSGYSGSSSSSSSGSSSSRSSSSSSSKSSSAQTVANMIDDSSDSATTNIPSSPATNITKADTLKSGITGGTPTWSLDYYAVDKSGTQETQTWKSSTGAQVAFAGISAAELAKYEAEKGHTENAAIYSQIAAATANGATKTMSIVGVVPEGTNISGGNLTISNPSAISYPTSKSTYDFSSPSAFAKSVSSGASSGGSTFTGGAQGVADMIDSIGTPTSNIPIEPSPGNIPIIPSTPSSPVTPNTPVIPHTEPVKPATSESSTLLDLLTARLGQLVAGGGNSENTDGGSDGGIYPIQPDSTSEGTQTNYMPIIIIGGVVVAAVAGITLFSKSDSRRSYGRAQ